MAKFREKYRWVCFIWTYLECLGFGGLLFGWSSLVYVLKDEGLYLDLCEHENNTSALLNSSGLTKNECIPHTDVLHTCEARDARLTLVFTVGSSLMCAGICVIGLINLKFGTRVTRLVIFVLFTIGALAMAFANKDYPWLLFLGLSLLGMAGNILYVTNVQISFLFPVWGTLVTGLFNGAVDSSAIIQLLVKIGHENGVSRFTSYVIITCAHPLTLISTFFFLPRYFIEKRPVETENKYELTGKEENSMGEVKKGKEEDLQFQLIGATKTDVHQEDEQENQSKESSPSFVRCLLSPQFTLHLFWFSVLHIRFLFYLASVNIVLEDMLATKQQVSEYTNVMLFILLFGAVVSVLPGLFFDYNVKFFQKSTSILKRRLMPSVFPLTLTTMITSLLSVFSIFTGPKTIYVEFALVAFLRAFLFSNAVFHMRQLFPSQFLTTLFGVLFFGAGLVNLFQYALFIWVESYSFQQVNIFLLVMALTTLIHPGYLWTRSSQSPIINPANGRSKTKRDRRLLWFAHTETNEYPRKQ